jgi:hypothetical protein
MKPLAYLWVTCSIVVDRVADASLYSRPSHNYTTVRLQSIRTIRIEREGSR